MYGKGNYKRVDAGAVVATVNEQFVSQILSLRPTNASTRPATIQLVVPVRNRNDSLVQDFAAR